MAVSGSLVYPCDPVVDGELWFAAAQHHEKGSTLLPPSSISGQGEKSTNQGPEVAFE